MAHAITDYRAIKGLTQKTLASALGVSVETLGRFEAGNVGKVQPRVVGAFARVLGITIEDAEKVIAGQWVPALGPRGGTPNGNQFAGVQDAQGLPQPGSEVGPVAGS